MTGLGTQSLYLIEKHQKIPGSNVRLTGITARFPLAKINGDRGVLAHGHRLEQVCF